MTGGGSTQNTATTEILENINNPIWTVLENGKLPGRYQYRGGVRLATVDNNVYAFGIILHFMTFN